MKPLILIILLATLCGFKSLSDEDRSKLWDIRIKNAYMTGYAEGVVDGAEYFRKKAIETIKETIANTNISTLCSPQRPQDITATILFHVRDKITTEVYVRPSAKGHYVEVFYGDKVEVFELIKRGINFERCA